MYFYFFPCCVLSIVEILIIIIITVLLDLSSILNRGNVILIRRKAIHILKLIFKFLFIFFRIICKNGLPQLRQHALWRHCCPRSWWCWSWTRWLFVGHSRAEKEEERVLNPVGFGTETDRGVGHGWCELSER